jgi:peptidoglycan/LPS O-acetylase OafA/YrhL
MLWIFLIGLTLFIFRKEIARNPRNFIALIGGIFSAWVVLKVFQADPGYELTPIRTWIIGVMLLAALVWGTEIFGGILDRIWPRDRGDRRGV